MIHQLQLMAKRSLYQLVNQFEQHIHHQVLHNRNIWFIKKINVVFDICLKCNFKRKDLFYRLRLFFVLCCFSEHFSTKRVYAFNVFRDIHVLFSGKSRWSETGSYFLLFVSYLFTQWSFWNENTTFYFYFVDLFFFVE